MAAWPFIISFINAWLKQNILSISSKSISYVKKEQCQDHAWRMLHRNVYNFDNIYSNFLAPKSGWMLHIDVIVAACIMVVLMLSQTLDRKQLIHGFLVLFIFTCIHTHIRKGIQWWRVSCCINTLRPRQMAAIFQTTFSNAFYWMKMFELWLKCHWGLLTKVKLIIFQLWLR